MELLKILFYQISLVNILYHHNYHLKQIFLWNLMVFKIYKPSKTSMQSGRAKTKKWIVEFVPDENFEKDHLMGWNISNNTKEQIKLFFDDKQSAINWANEKNYQFEVIENSERKIKPKNYSDNFSYKRKEPWTH